MRIAEPAPLSAGPRLADQTHDPGQVSIRSVERSDEREFIALAQQSLELHRPWITAPTTAADFRSKLSALAMSGAEGFVVCAGAAGGIVGFINVNEVVRGPYQRGLLGFGAFTPYQGRGYMSHGLRLVVHHAITELGLHRVEADVQPANLRSRLLLQRNGFRCEGISPGFVRINGEWKDHERWALVCGL